MALDNFIPSVWAGALLRALDTALVYPQLMNRDYEGDVSEVGDTVRINMVGDVTIATYAKNTDLNSPETLSDAQVILAVDRGRYFNFQIDDVDKAQTKPKVMEEAMRRSAYGLRKETDAYIAGLYTDIATGNFIGTDASPKTDLATANVPYNYLVDLNTKLDEADTPDDGRFCVVPPWFEGYLLKDARFVSGATEGALRRLAEGRIDGQAAGAGQPGYIGRAAGFDIYKSNQVVNTSATKYKIIAGHPMAWSFADQIMKVEAYRPERRFADAVKGLHVYGAKVTRPSNLACLVANPT